jgi:Mg-chelatase subunit ChlD
MASMKSLKTDFIAFDTAVVDLTAQLNDPVDLLFATQLGGGTDIGKALTYANQIIGHPEQTVVVLITDLFEGGDERKMIALVAHLLSRGVQLVTLLALSDEGQPSYNHALAGKIAELGVKPLACTPDAFPELMAGVLQQLR